MEKSRSLEQDGTEVSDLRALALDDSGTCLAESEISFIKSKPQYDKYRRRKALVRYSDGTESERTMAEVMVAIGKGRRMWADVVTGTLYKPNGSCRSSARINVLEWR